METIRVDPLIPAVNRGGKIVIDAPAGIADGEEVMVGLQTNTPAESPIEKWGMDEADWPTDPDAIEAWCRRLDALEPVDFPSGRRIRSQIPRISD
jgi:hypothetical protein